jgi:hypothetical protein
VNTGQFLASHGENLVHRPWLDLLLCYFHERRFSGEFPVYTAVYHIGL